MDSSIVYRQTRQNILKDPRKSVAKARRDRDPRQDNGKTRKSESYD